MVKQKIKLSSRLAAFLLAVLMMASLFPAAAFADGPEDANGTPAPTEQPAVVEQAGTGEPDDTNTPAPTVEPTAEPTTEPTAEPTVEPTAEPTAEPTTEPEPEQEIEDDLIGFITNQSPLNLSLGQNALLDLSKYDESFVVAKGLTIRLYKDAIGELLPNDVTIKVVIDGDTGDAANEYQVETKDVPTAALRYEVNADAYTLKKTGWIKQDDVFVTNGYVDLGIITLNTIKSDHTITFNVKLNCNHGCKTYTYVDKDYHKVECDDCVYTVNQEGHNWGTSDSNGISTCSGCGAVKKTIMLTYAPGEGISGVTVPAAVSQTVYAAKGGTPQATFTVVSPTGAPQGKEFDYWKNGEGKVAVGSSITVTENTTLTAVWKCAHDQTKAIDNGDETHKIVCNACGETLDGQAAVAHFWNDKHICEACGAQAVAETDGKYYTTLQAAVDAISTNGTIKMVANSNKPATIAAGKTITLNVPAGVTLSNEGGTNQGSWANTVLRNYGTLTIAGKGTIRVEKGTNHALHNYEGAVACLNGCTFMTDTNDYIVWNRGTMTIDGANIIGTGTDMTAVYNGWRDGEFDPNRTDYNALLTMRSGSIVNSTQRKGAVLNNDWATFIMEGGEIKAPLCVLNWDIAEIKGGSLTVAGTGSKVISSGAASTNYNRGQLAISGGDFYSDNGATTVLSLQSGAKPVITGGTFFADDPNVRSHVSNDAGLYAFNGKDQNNKDAIRWKIGALNVALNKTQTALNAGENETLTATVTPGDAAYKNVTWKSSDEAVATVDNSGKITAVAAGTATITAASVGDPTKSASCTVTVSAPSSGTGGTPTTYTVTYTDGVGGTVFANETHAVAAGGTTPAFAGSLVRDGYTFAGWTPAVAQTVTGNATYTAQWTAAEPVAPLAAVPVAPAPAAPAAPEEELEEPEAPLAGPENTPAPSATPEPEELEEPEAPLAGPEESAWALINLLLALVTLLGGALTLLGLFGKRGSMRLASILPALGAPIAFLLTENLRGPMAFTDRWTLLMAVIALVQLALSVLAHKQSEKEQEQGGDNA